MKANQSGGEQAEDRKADCGDGRGKPALRPNRLACCACGKTRTNRHALHGRAGDIGKPECSEFAIGIDNLAMAKRKASDGAP